MFRAQEKQNLAALVETKKLRNLRVLKISFELNLSFTELTTLVH